MTQQKEFTLIEGVFSSEEAWEIIHSLYSSKIHFHEMRNFSSIERFGKDDPAAISRLNELKKNMDGILQLLRSDKVAIGNFKIKSTIIVQFDDEGSTVL